MDKKGERSLRDGPLTDVTAAYLSRREALEPLCLEPLSQGLPAFPLFFHGRFFIVTSLFDLLEQTVFLELPLK
jgi:hypothetical protein